MRSNTVQSGRKQRFGGTYCFCLQCALCYTPEYHLSGLRGLNRDLKFVVLDFLAYTVIPRLTSDTANEFFG